MSASYEREFGVAGEYSVHFTDGIGRHRDQDYGFNGIFTEEGGNISGTVTDSFGDATISGTLNTDTLNFAKTYIEDPTRPPILYNYQLDGGTYRGKYQGDDDRSHATYCKILEGATPVLPPKDSENGLMKDNHWYSLP